MKYDPNWIDKVEFLRRKGMSNLEHVFEVTLKYVKDGFTMNDYLREMTSSNCHHNARTVDIRVRRNGYGVCVATLNDGRLVVLQDIWELAQYTQPLLNMIEDLKEAQDE